jgi:hypothetical protein
MIVPASSLAGGSLGAPCVFLSLRGDLADERAQARDLLLGLARGPFVRG